MRKSCRHLPTSNKSPRSEAGTKSAVQGSTNYAGQLGPSGRAGSDLGVFSPPNARFACAGNLHLSNRVSPAIVEPGHVSSPYGQGALALRTWP